MSTARVTLTHPPVVTRAGEEGLGTGWAGEPVEVSHALLGQLHPSHRPSTVYHLHRMRAREDVEHLLRVERLPLGVEPVYDSDRPPFRVRAKRVELEPPWNTNFFTLEELRSEVVHAVLNLRDGVRDLRDRQGLQPFTIIGAHEVMANRDLALDALLVHPDFTPLLCKVQASPWYGVSTKVFTHFEVPPGDVYGFAQPTYVGVCPIWEGAPGVLIHNPNGLVWGSFARRAGV